MKEDDKTARFEKGVDMTLQEMIDYFKDSPNPEAAEKWEKFQKKYEDKFKKEATLKDNIVRAAHQNSELRQPLKSLLIRIASSLPKKS